MTRRRTIIAHHLILTGYGHWLANDLRGSGSFAFYDEKFAPLGPIHHGRKPAHMQPTRQQLRAFYQQADDLLNFPCIWFTDAMRCTLGRAVGEVIAAEGYTCYAFAAMANHLHLAIRRHRDDAAAMLSKITEHTASQMRLLPEFGPHHPVWANRPYKVFVYTPDDVRTRIGYIEENPEKESLPPQHWPFVTAYDNWPLHKARGREDASVHGETRTDRVS
ncbi:MAG: hypothetical protein H7210_13880 [Pyrinomonadaceae bacterium]|nr:hypothetical protein [Phycisphaerales bacterium]